MAVTDHTPPSPSGRESSAIISRLHQQTAGIIAGVCLLTMGVYGAVELRQRGRMIDIERPAAVRPVASHIDINNAGWPELTMLPGISETLARRLVEFREQHGDYQSLDDLRMVKGIGPKSVARLRPYLAPLPAARRHDDRNADVAAQAAP